jgi:hypothetical protein
MNGEDHERKGEKPIIEDSPDERGAQKLRTLIYVRLPSSSLASTRVHIFQLLLRTRG